MTSWDVETPLTGSQLESGVHQAKSCSDKVSMYQSIKVVQYQSIAVSKYCSIKVLQCQSIAVSSIKLLEICFAFCGGSNFFAIDKNRPKMDEQVKLKLSSNFSF